MTTKEHFYELPPLPYPRDALAGISATTLHFHYDCHHRAYVEKLNALIVGDPLNGKPLIEVVRQAKGALFNNAAQAWNHEFYWNGLTPEKGLSPRGDLAAAIRRDFNSLDGFLEQFRSSALSKFGSGWTWLVADHGRLAVVNTDDANNPLRDGRTPLLTCDVWEHAYYIDYRHERARYVDAFLQLVNWPFVEQNLAALRAR